MVGTPTVIAPGAIYLVGELGLPEEGLAVLAALSSYATAQYFPDVVALSPLVAAVVDRAKTQLGEAAAALPAGSVLLSPAKAGEDGGGITFETAPAIAVATAAAVFETAGQSISERGDEIFLVAKSGHRAVHGEMGAEGELAAALHGGLVQVVFQPAAVPRIEALPSPAGLHLVVFATGHALFPADWRSSVRRFAERERLAYARIIDELLDQAAGFAAELSKGNAKAALASAERYGDCITHLAAAASAPLQCEPFVRAIELAKEVGGIAKTTSAGRGDLGIAMFATPDAANRFSRACRAPLVALSFDLDHSGVRCLVPHNVESAPADTPAPATGASSISAEAIVQVMVDQTTTEKTLGDLPGESPATPQALTTEGERPVPEPAVFQPQRPVRRHHHRAKFGLAIGGMLFVAVLLAVWLSRSRGHQPPPVTRPTLSVPSAPATGSSGSTTPTVPVEAEPTRGEAAAPRVAPPSNSEPPSVRPHISARPSRTLPSGRAKSKMSAPAAVREPNRPPTPRAGRLSPEDF